MAFPVEEKYIINTEKELGVRFPDSFRKRMMESNGEGVEVKQDYFGLYPFYDTSDKKELKERVIVFCMKQKKSVNITVYLKTLSQLETMVEVIF